MFPLVVAVGFDLHRLAVNVDPLTGLLCGERGSRLWCGGDCSEDEVADNQRALSFSAVSLALLLGIIGIKYREGEKELHYQLS